MKKQQGFTLIELMIVVAIIGVLSAIAIPAYKDYVAKSEMASAMATMKALITPAELQIQENGALSTAVSTLGIEEGSNTLGKITATTNTLVFTFDEGSLLNKKLTFTRSPETGWKCVSDADTPTVEGCPKS